MRLLSWVASPRKKTKPSSWILSIASHYCIDRLRRRHGETLSLDEIPPISQNVATYKYGDDLFDEVNSIEANGDFLGEYGVAIADATGVGGPKKVSAFEVWLFDKGDIPTTTKVLMIPQAFEDSAKREKLKTKGEPVLADLNRPVDLQTKNLHLRAQIVSMDPAQGAAGWG